MRKKALYVRVSTDMQVEGYSIDAQIELLKSFLKSKEWKTYEIYTDPGYSGKNLERPAIQKLIQDCKKGKIDTVLVFKLDRLSRSQKDTLFLIEEIFNKYDIGFISIRESFDTTTPFGKAMIGILSVFAQLERETILERTRLGLQKRAEEGLWRGGGKIPFAYDYDTKNGILVINKERKQIFDIMKNLRLTGYSYHQLSKIMGYEESWIQEILNCQTNLGLIPYKGKFFKGKHEAIISETEYKQLQEIEKNRKKYSSAKHYLLTGKIYCGLCGAKYRYQKWGKRTLCYCYSQQKSKPKLIKDPNCQNRKIDSYHIENSFLEQLWKMKIDKRKMEKEKNLQKIDLKKDLNNNLKKIQKRKEKLIHFLDNGLAKEEVICELKKLEKEKENTIQAIKNLQRSSPFKKDEKNTLKELWLNLQFEEKRILIEQLVNKIVIYENSLKIYWNIYFI